MSVDAGCHVGWYVHFLMPWIISLKDDGTFIAPIRLNLRPVMWLLKVQWTFGAIARYLLMRFMLKLAEYDKIWHSRNHFICVLRPIVWNDAPGCGKGGDAKEFCAFAKVDGSYHVPVLGVYEVVVMVLQPRVNAWICYFEEVENFSVVTDQNRGCLSSMDLTEKGLNSPGLLFVLIADGGVLPLNSQGATQNLYMALVEVVSCRFDKPGDGRLYWAFIMLNFKSDLAQIVKGMDYEMGSLIMLMAGRPCCGTGQWLIWYVFLGRKTKSSVVVFSTLVKRNVVDPVRKLVRFLEFTFVDLEVGLGVSTPNWVPDSRIYSFDCGLQPGFNRWNSQNSLLWIF